MKLWTRRIISFAAILAVGAVLGTVISASASQPAGDPATTYTIHFRIQPTYQHYVPNGATKNNPSSAMFVESLKLMSGTNQIGTAEVVGTIVGTKAKGILNVAANFTGKGTADLQSLWNSNVKGNTFALIGGTGAFEGATGEVIGSDHGATFTYST